MRRLLGAIYVRGFKLMNLKLKKFNLSSREKLIRFVLLPLVTCIKVVATWDSTVRVREVLEQGAKVPLGARAVSGVSCVYRGDGGVYHRALILPHTPGMGEGVVLVRDMDTGYSKVVSVGDVYEMSEEVASAAPAHILTCALRGSCAGTEDKDKDDEDKDKVEDDKEKEDDNGDKDKEDKDKVELFKSHCLASDHMKITIIHLVAGDEGDKAEVSLHYMNTTGEPISVTEKLEAALGSSGD